MRIVIRYLISLTPWVLSMYLLYWLETTGTWTTETQHRDKMSLIILMTGMGISFFGYSYFNKGRGKDSSNGM